MSVFRISTRLVAAFHLSWCAPVLLALFVLVASQAAADPELTFDSVALGDGLTGWDVGIAFDDGEALSTFVDVTFEGHFSQIQFDGLDVDTDELAMDLDGLFGYEAAFDSFFITSVWPDVLILEGGEVMSAIYDFAAGSGGGSQIIDFIELAYLVLPEGEVLTYDAEVSRGGVNYTLVPEPGSTLLALAAIGTLSAVRRRKSPVGRLPRSTASARESRRPLSHLMLTSLLIVALTACSESGIDGVDADAPTGGETSTEKVVSRSSSAGLATARSSTASGVVADSPGTGDAAARPGDANGDGFVDDEDYAIWKDNFGQDVPAGTLGDHNFDGTVDGADYTLWADHLVSSEDPCIDDAGADADGDGLSDCTEIYKSRTLPDVADTDGDGRSDGNEWQLFDPDNNIYLFNPRIADLPTVAIDLTQLPLVEIDYQISGSETITIGTEFSSSSTESISTGRGASISEQVSFAHSINASVMIGVEVGASATGPEAKYKSALTVGFEATETHSQGSSVNWSQNESASRTDSYHESETASQTEGFSFTGGRLNAVVEIRNNGGVSYQISDVFLTAQLVDPLRPLAVETIGTMQFDGGQALVAQVQSGQAVGPFSYTISDLTLGRAQNLLRDRRDIAVTVGSYILEDITGTSTLLREDDVAALTATVIIDYGAGSDRVDQFRVAIRQPTGEKFISALEALRDILGLHVVQGSGIWIYPDGTSFTPYGLRSIGSHALSASTTRYWQVAHNHNNESGTLARTTDSMNIVLDEFDLRDILLRAGDKLVLSYIGDQDRDGIPDRVEEKYGTDPLMADTDQDGLTDSEELYGWLTNLGTPPCDEGDLVRVFSDPLLVDSDNDGELDASEKAACQNPSADFVADAGSDQDVNQGSTVNMLGSFRGQTSGPSVYTWQIIDGPPVLDSDLKFTTTLEGQSPRFTAPSDVVSLIFELTISMGDLQQTDLVTVNVFENLATMIFVGEVNEDGFEIGTRNNPYGTLEEAHADHPEADLYVMTREDVYELESPLIMDSGVSIYGGYDAAWIRNAADNKTGILVQLFGDFQSALYYDTVADDTTISGLAITGVNRMTDSSSSVVAIMVNPDSPQVATMRVLDNDIEVPDVAFEIWFERENLPGSSYGMFFRNLANLEIRNNTVYSGMGGFGAYGARGATGAAGEGFVGGAGGNGKSSSLLGGAGSNGDAGDNNKSGPCSNGGAGGGVTFFDLLPPTAGNGGCTGNNGAHQPGVVGQAFAFADGGGDPLPPRYVPLVGTTGSTAVGGSGGGGGGGGSADAFSTGGKGGKGGTGGGGSKGGLGGVSAGASIGIWLYQVQDVSIHDNSIRAAAGGDGGQSGSGGSGRSGNSGAAGGAKSGNAFAGARGGKGGTSGSGGDGGAGHGGASIAVFVDEVVRSASIEGNQLTTWGGGRGGWTSRSAGSAGGGGDSFGVYLHSQASGTPSMEDNEFTIAPAGTPNSPFPGTPGDAGETSWE